MRRSRSLAALAMTIGLVTASCQGGTTHPTVSGSPTRGGVYRTAVDSFFNSDGFDPTGEYSNSGFDILPEMLIRTLLTYDHVAGNAGNKLVPDIATSMPTISADGLTYRFHLKSGIRFGSPVNRDVTSHDIEYAFERINMKSLIAQYGFYYDGVIQGMTGSAPRPGPISGIDTPDARTIVFHLAKPAGDFEYRIALPAAGPIPKEVAHCFTKAGDYGRYIISSGPYMIRGSGQLDISSCSSMKPISGFDLNKGMILVRNPAYDPATDSPSIRENFLDGISITIDTNTADIYDRIQRGELDGDWLTQEPATFVQQVQTNPQGISLRSNPNDGISYITMNLLTPPFDDVHVRRAVNWVMDKAALLRANGGPLFGQIATHVFPATMLSVPASYDPYATQGGTGDLSKAKAEMRLSRYDHNRDGVCDDPACRNVLMISSTAAPSPNQDPIIESALAGIGIHLKVQELTPSSGYSAVQAVKGLVPMASFTQWGKDYADPYTYAVLFDSAGIICQGQSNYSEVGMTAAQASACGVSTQWRRVRPPSVDGLIARCERLSQASRASCWTELDKTVTSQIVPWVPFLWSHTVTTTASTVTKFEFDQNAGLISFVHTAVDNHVDPNSLSF